MSPGLTIKYFISTVFWLFDWQNHFHQIYSLPLSTWASLSLPSQTLDDSNTVRRVHCAFSLRLYRSKTKLETHPKMLLAGRMQAHVTCLVCVITRLTLLSLLSLKMRLLLVAHFWHPTPAYLSPAHRYTTLCMNTNVASQVTARKWKFKLPFSIINYAQLCIASSWLLSNFPNISSQ